MFSARSNRQEDKETPFFAEKGFSGSTVASVRREESETKKNFRYKGKELQKKKLTEQSGIVFEFFFECGTCTVCKEKRQIRMCYFE